MIWQLPLPNHWQENVPLLPLKTGLLAGEGVGVWEQNLNCLPVQKKAFSIISEPLK